MFKTILEQIILKPFVDWLNRDENQSLRLPISLSLITFVLLLVLLGIHFTLKVSLVREILEALPVTLLFEITHWLPTSFLVVGILLCVFAAYTVVRDFRQKQKCYGAAILFLAATLYLVSWHLLQPSREQGDIAIVAVARFTPVGSLSEDDAVHIARRIRDQLSSRFSELAKDETGKAPLARVKFLKNAKIEGADEEELRLAAIMEAKKVSADLIVWGEVCKEQGMLKATSKISLIGLLDKFEVEFRPVTAPEDFTPPHLVFKDKVAQDTSHVATFVCGLIYYFREEFDKALHIFQNVGDSASDFYAGSIFAKRAQRSSSPHEDLLQAKHFFERVIDVENDSESLQSRELRWDAALNLGSVLVSLGIASNPDRSREFFQQAIDLYDEALKISPRVSLPTAQARVQNNLGMALIEIAVRKPPLERRPILDRAVSVLESSLQLCDKKYSLTERAQAQNYLGIAMRYLSEISNKEIGEELLRKAVKGLDEALLYFSQREDRINCALVQIDRAAALSDLGRAVKGDEQHKLMKSAIASLRAALDTPIEKKLPYAWAMAKYNLGNTLSDLADISDQQQNLYEEALQNYQSALQVFSFEQYPEKWAQTQEMIGLAFFDLAQRAKARQATDLLGKAVVASKSALKVYSLTSSPSKWISVQLQLARILATTSYYQENENKTKTLTEARDELSSVFAVLKRDSDPNKWAEANNGMGGILALLARTEEIRYRIELDKQAVHYFREALTILTFEQHPEEWAKTKLNLGSTLRDLGLHLSGDEGKQNLSDAVVEFRDALRADAKILPSNIRQQLSFLVAETLADIALRTEHPDRGIFFRQSAEAYLNAFDVYEISDRYGDTQLRLFLAMGNIQIGGTHLAKDYGKAVKILRTASTTPNLKADERAYIDFALGIALSQLATFTDRSEARGLLQEASARLKVCRKFFDRKEYPREHLFLQRTLGVVSQLIKQLNNS